MLHRLFLRGSQLWHTFLSVLSFSPDPQDSLLVEVFPVRTENSADSREVLVSGCEDDLLHIGESNWESIEEAENNCLIALWVSLHSEIIHHLVHSDEELVGVFYVFPFEGSEFFDEIKMVEGHCV